MEAELKPLIHCELCKKILKDPRYLPCLHTFCRTCIDDSIKATTKSDPTRTYYCPKCSRVVSFSRDMKLGENLPRNNLAANVIDGYQLQSGSVGCKPCNRKRTSGQATQWCSKCKEPLCDNCTESHKSFRTTLGHEIINISKMKGRPLKELLVGPLCAEHNEEQDHFCQDHKVFICSECKASTHRSCKSILTVSHYAQRLRDENKSVAYSIGQHERNAKILLENRMKEKESLDISKAKVTDKITSIRRKINDILTKYEKQCLQELDDIYSKEKTVLETDVLGAQGIYNTAQNMNNVLKAASKHGNDVHFVEWQRKIEKESELLNDTIYDIHEPLTTSQITFKINPDIEKVLQSTQNIGGFTMKKEKVNLIPGLDKSNGMDSKENEDQLDTISMLSYQLPAEQYNVKTVNDEHTCFITGMAMLPTNQLVCADKNNSKIKVFDSDFQLRHEHELEFAPFDVTAVGGHKVGVTIPSKSSISVLSIGINVVYKASIDTDEACYGISYSNKRFAFTCPMTKPPCVKMITDTGSNIMTICPDETYIPKFVRPWYVKFDGKGSHLYVSDSQRAQICCCVGGSLQRFTYQHERLNAPRGLALRQNDDFFVVGWGSDNIHFVDGNGEFIKEVVNRWNGTFSPQTMCLTRQEDSIIVSLDVTSCSSDLLLVFSLPEDKF